MKIKKFNETAEADGNGETWKDFFIRQTASGRRFKELYKDEFERRKFIDRSDAVWICKKAQADTYEHIINKLSGKVDESIIEELKTELQQHWDKDDSGLAY